MKIFTQSAGVFLAVLLAVSCRKNTAEPVLLGGYESAKVRVAITHIPTSSGGGGDLDTDQGVSERELWGEGAGKTAGLYSVRSVTTTGFTLDYKMTIEDPIGSTPRPFQGAIQVPYSESVTEAISDNYTITVSVHKK